MVGSIVETLRTICRLSAAGLALLAPFAGAQAKVRFHTLYSFAGSPNDGASPEGALVVDKVGNLYGTTAGGGDSGVGTVFEISPDGIETVLYSFSGADGAGPVAGLIMDKTGDFYGTTQNGGAYGHGTIFKLAPDGTETVLYSFCVEANCTDGANPKSELIADKDGNLYGTTSEGGGGTRCSGACGTVFKLAPDGTETVLHAFVEGNDGGYPFAGLISDKGGNLYGTTMDGGGAPSCRGAGCGTVFKVAPDGSELVLYAFTGGTAGAYPEAGVILDKKGNLYGTTSRGGKSSCYAGCGTIFKVSPDGKETVLYNFAGGSDGSYPTAGLVTDWTGDLYGTTLEGGTNSYGTVFQLARTGTERVLHSFTASNDGGAPVAGLVPDKNGYLYGTASSGGGAPSCGGTGCGVVFKIEK